MLRRAAFLLLVLLIPATASAAFPPVPHNPADALRGIPIDPIVYDSATHCVKHVPVGARRMEAWLEGHVRGESWGILRCEKWGKNAASLHAEGRAIDWHLD